MPNTWRRENLDTLPSDKIGGANLPAAVAVRLQALARSLHRLDENDANGYQDWRGDWDEAATLRAEKRGEAIERQLAELVAPFGFNVYHQGDCRGWPVYLWRQADLDEMNARFASYGADARPSTIDSVYNTIGIGVSHS